MHNLPIAGVGVQWSSLFMSVTPDSRLSFGLVLVWLVLQIGLSLLVAWYIDTVFPGGDAVAQKPWFFVQVRYSLVYSFWTVTIGK